ncbi:phage portal protein [Enterococcus avium]|uniref:phage portal protein n=1 Tax=Enterococcus avium TaxID=33945 RepID=UPI0032E526E8
MAVEGKGSITEDGVFIYPKEEQLTKADLNGFIEYHNGTLLPQFKKARDYYRGQHPILSNLKTSAIGKPDNRLVVNYPRYIVDTLNGFFIGIAPKITLDETTDNDLLQEFNNGNSFFDKLYEASKQVSIYGRSYFYAYQNEASKTQLAVISPERGFLIYDDTVAKEPYAFCMYAYDEENNLSGSVYLSDGSYDLSMENTGANPFKTVPAVEFYENEERQGTFENVLTLVDTVNQALSQKANDVDYFADAYLKILGATLDEDTLAQIKDNRIINLEGDGAAKDIIVDFLQKPNGDATQENLINRLSDLIFQISSVANITDQTFGSADSGKALEYHLLAMRNLAANKERKFTQALRSFYKIIFSVGTVLNLSKADEWKKLKFQFIRNLPSNLADEATTAKGLEGVVSKETQLKTLSIVDDPQAEIKRMAAETKKARDEATQSEAQYDFQKSGELINDEKE